MAEVDEDAEAEQIAEKPCSHTEDKGEMLQALEHIQSVAAVQGVDKLLEKGESQVDTILFKICDPARRKGAQGQRRGSGRLGIKISTHEAVGAGRTGNSGSSACSSGERGSERSDGGGRDASTSVDGGIHRPSSQEGQESGGGSSLPHR